MLAVLSNSRLEMSTITSLLNDMHVRIESAEKRQVTSREKEESINVDNM